MPNRQEAQLAPHTESLAAISSLDSLDYRGANRESYRRALIANELNIVKRQFAVRARSVELVRPETASVLFIAAGDPSEVKASNGVDTRATNDNAASTIVPDASPLLRQTRFCTALHLSRSGLFREVFFG
jgi:hypothetical protein